MNPRLTAAVAAFALGVAFTAQGKIPPPPPLDEKGKAAAEEKKAKDAAAAEKTKAQQVAAEDRAVKNFQGNMKKAGKPVPKPTPIGSFIWERICGSFAATSCRSMLAAPVTPLSDT
jgi:hypothetical protein